MNYMPWTFYSTHTAAQTHGFFDYCTVINHSDCTCCTGLLTDSTADAAGFTLFLCFRTFFLIGAFYHYIIGTFMNMNHILRADFRTGSTTDTFLFLYFCYPIFIDGNGSEFTFIYTGSTADTAVCTSCFTLSRSAPPITCYNR